LPCRVGMKSVVINRQKALDYMVNIVSLSNLSTPCLYL
jgi:hypothetical protein